MNTQKPFPETAVQASHGWECGSSARAGRSKKGGQQMPGEAWVPFPRRWYQSGWQPLGQAGLPWSPWPPEMG